MTPIATIISLVAFAPAACGGDSTEEGSGAKGGGAGAGDGGTAGDGGPDTGGTNATGGKGGTGGTAGSAGKGGTAGRGGATSTGGNGGTGVAGEGGFGGVGEPGGEGGAGGATGCMIAEDASISGTLKITTDDNYRLYVNGTLIDETPRIWSSPQTYMVTLFRHPSRKNVIAVEGVNTQEIDGLDRAIIADLSFDAGAGTQNVVTDTSWKVSRTSATNWFAVAFDDGAWIAPFDEGAHGIAPYGAILGTSTARLIWAYNANAPASAKPDPPEHIFVRKTFYLNFAGMIASSPGSCP